MDTDSRYRFTDKMNFDFHEYRHQRVELNSALGKIEQAELVRRLREADPAYLFKHALVQDSAYSTLMKQQRKHLHQLVAVTLERAYPEHLDDNAARLAQHYAEAGDDEKTFEFASRAGDAAARRFAYPEARLHYADALNVLSRLPDNDETSRRAVDTMLKHVSVALRAQGPAETLHRLTQSEMLAQAFAERAAATREDRLRLARVQFWQGHALLHSGDPRAALQKMRQVYEVAQVENDAPLLAVSASIIGRGLGLQGNFAQAIPILSDAIPALEQMHDEHEWIFSIGMRGFALAMRGDVARGIAEVQRTVSRAQEAGTLTGTSVANFLLAMTYLFCDEIALAAEHARVVIETAAKSGDRLHAYVGHGYLAWAQTRALELADAETSFAQAQTIADAIDGRLVFSDWFMMSRAEWEFRRGAYAQAMALTEQAIPLAEKSGGMLFPGLAHRLWGQALAAQNQADPTKVETHFASALALFVKGDAQLEVARTRLAWGAFLRERGNMEAAHAHFAQAAAQFETSGLTRELQESFALSRNLA